MRNWRKSGPEIRMIEHIEPLSFDHIVLDNGMDLYCINQGTQDILKIEIVFRAGRTYEQKKVVSRACNSQIKEGIEGMNSRAIVNQIDYYGATLRTSSNLDDCSIHLFCLTKHFDELIPLLFKIVNSPVFPKHELKKFIDTNSERLKVELEKNDVIAYRKITEAIFTAQHPYGYNSEISDYQKLNRTDLVSHYERNYGYNNGYIFISGKVDDYHIRSVNAYFGKQLHSASPHESLVVGTPTKPSHLHFSSNQEYQTAIKIGKRLFARNHPDYAGMYVLNMVLGGYFGSRLMSNIREEKGYTYNIYSEVDVMNHDGMFMIATEVSDLHKDSTIEEIFKEITNLSQTLISKEELDMVRNYILGRILNFIDGPFNSSRLLKSIILGNLPSDYLSNLVHTVKTIDAENLRSLCNQYISSEELWTVTVGS